MSIPDRYLDARLCFARDGFLWFTTKVPFESQWGDDWDDRPCGCNAGIPYSPHGSEEPHEVFCVAHCSSLEEANTDASAEWINKTGAAWLKHWNESTEIRAGETLVEVIRKVLRTDSGEIYIPYSWCVKEEKRC